MGIAILRVNGGLNCSHLTNSLATGNGKNEGALAVSGSTDSLGFDNQGLELDPDVVTEFRTPQLPKKEVGAESKLKFGKKRNKSANDLDYTGIYR